MRDGFSIIELIASIVVIGIIALSLPTILLQNNKNNEITINRQNIMQTSSLMTLALKTNWNDIDSLDNKTVNLKTHDNLNTKYDTIDVNSKISISDENIYGSTNGDIRQISMESYGVNRQKIIFKGYFTNSNTPTVLLKEWR